MSEQMKIMPECRYQRLLASCSYMRSDADPGQPMGPLGCLMTCSARHQRVLPGSPPPFATYHHLSKPLCLPPSHRLSACMLSLALRAAALDVMRSARGVRVRPGATQLTRTFLGAYVAAADNIRPAWTGKVLHRGRVATALLGSIAAPCNAQCGRP